MSTFVEPHPPRLSRCDYVAYIYRMAEGAELNFNCVILRLFAAFSGSLLLSFEISYSQQAVDYMH